MEHEQALEAEQLQDVAPTPQPRPSEVAQAEELWQEMLARYPPAHQELLRLKREGKSLAEIAEQTGLHPSSVRRILYELARHFAERGDTGPSPR
jgi:DNA-directed RNA polymerase specialized sigma24 family protein